MFEAQEIQKRSDRDEKGTLGETDHPFSAYGWSLSPWPNRGGVLCADPGLRIGGTGSTLAWEDNIPRLIEWVV